MSWSVTQPPGKSRVQLDDPAHQVRVRLLPEGFARLAEELVDERRHAVGERVGVEQRIVERVPLDQAADPDLEVVVPAPGVFENASDLMTKVTLDLEHERARALSGIAGLPGEDLAGEGVHAAAGLTRTHGAHDERAGVESLLGDDEPGRLLALARNDRMVQLADHERRRFILGRDGPLGQPTEPLEPEQRLEPDPPDGERERAREHDQDGGPCVMPDAERGVQTRVVRGDQVEVRVRAG